MDSWSLTFYFLLLMVTDCGVGKTIGDGLLSATSSVTQCVSDSLDLHEGGGDEDLPKRPDISLQCKECSRTFRKVGHLSRHYQCSGHGPVGPVEVGVRRRCSYTFARKRDLLMELDSIIRDGCQTPFRTLEKRTGIPMSNLFKWDQRRAEIFQRARTYGQSKLRKFRVCVADFPECEAMLFVKFIWRRRHLRRRVTRSWLQKEFSRILVSQGVDTTDGAHCSNGWASNFCKRWGISYQSRTNKHTRSLSSRVPQIQDFHRWLIYGLQRSQPQRCAKYGRFPPERMFHMDQVPCPFSPGSSRTLNLIGDQCAVTEPGGSGSTKRFCTLQVTICADPNQTKRLKLEIIFRGTGTRLKREEKEWYALFPNIKVRFQKKAWMDEVVSMQYLIDFREATLEMGEVLLGMDHHSAQQTPLCRDFMQMSGIVPAYTPPNCTDCVSPVDRNVGQTIKQKMAKRYTRDYDADSDAWHLPKKEGGLGNMKKRMLVAQWASEAWAEFTTENHTCILHSFIKTGFLIAKDGSENGKIELRKDFKYNF